MKYLATGLFAIVVLGSCQRSPDQVRVFKDPSGQYQYLVSTYLGTGPVSSDYTRIFVTASDDNNAAPTLVASGDYLSVSKVEFVGGYSAVLCKAGGKLDRYRPVVKLMISGASIPVRSKIDANCH